MKYQQSAAGSQLHQLLRALSATLRHIKTSADLDNMTGIGLGVIIYANLPICWIFGYQAMRAYKDYIRRLKEGRMGPDHPAPSIDDLISGRDVQR